MSAFADLVAEAVDPKPSGDVALIEKDWASWFRAVMPAATKAEFAPHHAAFGEWLWAIQAGRRPPPWVGVWSRGAAKSTFAEGGCVALGARRKRRYAIYVSEIQDAADDHVNSIGAILESSPLARYYPLMSERKISKYGASKGWRRNRLATASGFTVDALGLDTHVRGIKWEETRPDLIILDDIDSEFDTLATVTRKRKLITEAILPAATADVAVIAIQNLIHRSGIFAQLARIPGVEPADFLADRIVSGPIPAIEGFEYEDQTEPDGSVRRIITAGRPTWAGMDLAACQNLIHTEGITAFLTERQHLAEPPSGGLWSTDFPFQRCNPDEVPDLVHVVVWVDPAVTDTDQSDSHAIQVDGMDANGVIYRLWTWEQRTSPEDSLSKAIRKACELGSLTVGVETDQGGDTWQSVYRASLAQVSREMRDAGQDRPAVWPRYIYEKAGTTGQSKAARAQVMLTDYERPGRVIHVRGTHDVLERALRRFPKTKPFDAVDAAYWSWRDLDQKRGNKATISHTRTPLPKVPINSRPNTGTAGQGRSLVRAPSRQLPRTPISGRGIPRLP